MIFQLNTLNLRQAITHLAEALALTVKARVCRRLLALSVSNSHAVITQEELAQIIGVTRPTLRRCLAELEMQGAIETNYGKLRVVDPSVLVMFKDEQ